MKNFIFVVSAPSGAGKTSLLKKFLETDIGLDNFTVATSHTTRDMRDGEKHAREYYFVTENEFESMIKDDGFVEHAKVFKGYYGTSKAEIDRLLDSGKSIILEIDWQGARQVRNIYKGKCKSLFILPPSLKELEQRLKSRNTDSAEIIEYRMEQAESEISHADEYDMQIVNDDFDKTLKELESYFKNSLGIKVD